MPRGCRGSLPSETSLLGSPQSLYHLFQVNFMLTTFDPLRVGGRFGPESFRVECRKQSTGPEMLCWWRAPGIAWGEASAGSLWLWSQSAPQSFLVTRDKCPVFLSLGIECTHSVVLIFKIHLAKKYKTVHTEKTKGKCTKIFYKWAYIKRMLKTCLPHRKHYIQVSGHHYQSIFQMGGLPTTNLYNLYCSETMVSIVLF